MATSQLPLRPTVVALAALFIFNSTYVMAAHAKTPAAAVVAPGPTPEPLNLTAILEKGGQYTTLIRLLKETQVGQQIESQLNNSFDGLTIFAPSDNAFSTLKPGTLNSLTAQEQVALVLYHVLPRYYSLALFETASNPVRTQASGNDGVYTVNVTSTSNQVNVSTGVDETQISSELHTDFPLAVYSVEKVLLPYDLFGAKPPASAPPPELAPKKPMKSTPKAAAAGPSVEELTTPSAASVNDGRRIGWGFAVVGAAFLCAGGLI